MAAEQNRDSAQSQSRWYVVIVVSSVRSLIKASVLRLKGLLLLMARSPFTLTILVIEIEVAFTGNKPSSALKVEVIVGEHRDLSDLEDNGETFRWEGNL